MRATTERLRRLDPARAACRHGATVLQAWRGGYRLVCQVCGAAGPRAENMGDAWAAFRAGERWRETA